MELIWTKNTWAYLLWWLTSCQTQPPTNKSYIPWGWQWGRNKLIRLIYAEQAEYALLIRGQNVFSAKMNTMGIMKRPRAEKHILRLFGGFQKLNLAFRWLEIIQVDRLTGGLGNANTVPIWLTHKAPPLKHSVVTHSTGSTLLWLSVDTKYSSAT